MQDLIVSKAERYRKQANNFAELAKSASPAFLAEIYQRVAVRYVFMAEDLLKPERDADAIERADRMLSRLRLDVGARKNW
jgi:hypothetical protein